MLVEVYHAVPLAWRGTRPSCSGVWTEHAVLVLASAAAVLLP